MTTRDDPHRSIDMLDDKVAGAAHASTQAPTPTNPVRLPQWGEAYLLFDGQYHSLDDLLAQPGE